MNAVFANLLLLAVSLLGVDQQNAHQPVPKFAGKSIPDPPMQGQPWMNPPTKLPRFLVIATGVLFDEGVADPRGCEYREVETGDGQVVKTHGFVFPETPGAPHRFVVNWDGIVRPAFSVGAKCDMEADIRRLVEAMTTDRKKAEAAPAGRSRFAVGFGRAGYGYFGPAGVSDVDHRSPLKLVMLLRLGRADLAEALFSAGTPWTPATPGQPATKRDLTDYSITYLTLAQDWAGTLYARGADAHARSDDVVALDALRRVEAFRKSAERSAAEMGFPKNLETLGMQGPNDRPSYLAGLRQLTELLADQERRVKEEPRPPLPPRGSDPKARIAALIRDFDQIGERQMSVPGGAYPGGAAVVREVESYGDAAVEPLLDVLESDTRLTRSVSFGRGRGMGSDRYIHPVFETALPALQAILKAREIPGVNGTPRPDDLRLRKAQAGAIRAYWVKNRGVPVAERWFRTLADDSAGDRQWLEAASAIVAPGDQAGGMFPYAFNFNAARTPPKPGAKVALLGEPLRSKRDPSVTDLLIQRASILSRGQGFDLNNGTTFAEILNRWDPPAALPLIRTLTGLIRAQTEQVDPGSGNFGNAQYLGSVLARFTEIRVQAGDTAALDAYAAWVRRFGPKALQHASLDALAPLWNHPDHPAIAASARWMFTDKASPWLPLYPTSQGMPFFEQTSLCTSPLLRLPPFREALFATLADRSEIGTVTVEPPSQVRYALKNGGSGGFGSGSVDLEKLDPKTTTPLRVCDLVAYHLGQLDGTPACELFWPVPRRDAAIVSLVDFLAKYGDRFSALELPDDYGSFPGRHVHLAFPALGRPATAADVRAGRALFSLDDRPEGPARVVPLPKIPLRAKWVTLKEFPFNQQQGSNTVVRDYDQDGWVWQAEEVGQGDTLRRYFGFVGHSIMARVSATDLEFSPHSFWQRDTLLSGGLTTSLTLPEFRPDPGAGLRLGRLLADLHPASQPRRRGGRPGFPGRSGRPLR